MSSPCDYGMCDISRCSDSECLGLPPLVVYSTSLPKKEEINITQFDSPELS